MQRHKGFTLLELMIVIAIIAIIAAIAIPNLIESRKAANEAGAIQVMRTIVSAQTMYRDRDMDKNGIHDYCNSFGDLEQSGALRLPRVPGSSEVQQSGYTFGLIDPVPPATIRDSWRAVGLPVARGRSGERFFYVDDTGVIRFATNGAVPDFVDDNTLPDFSTWQPIGG